MTPRPSWWRRDPDGRLVVLIGPAGPLTIGAGPFREIPAPVPRAKMGPKLQAMLDAGRHPVPGRIAAALDLYGLYGPEVDEALGVAEPDVDRWEAGTLEPTLDQVRRLATLTAFAPPWFYDPMPARTAGVFICGRGRGARSGWHEYTEPPTIAQRQLILDTAEPDDEGSIP